MTRLWLLWLACAIGAACSGAPALAQACSAVAAVDWRLTMNAKDEPFAAEGRQADEPRWVKFTILLCDANRVYFQDSRLHPFHYDFASRRLGPFLGATPAAFDAATLHWPGQQAVLGAVLLPGRSLTETGPAPAEIAIQFVRQTPYSKETTRNLFNLVKSKITGLDGITVYYFPTYEQQGVAEANRAWFESEGIPVGSAARWTRGSRCYAEGWALGTVREVPGAQVGEAYRLGLLRPGDILLTDGVPAEVPPVAGIVSLSPGTPNSHAAILSATWGIPFVYAAGDQAEAARAAVGRRAVLRAYVSQFGACEAEIVDVEGELTPALEAEILGMKRPEPLAYAPTARLGAYSVGVDALSAGDIRYVGGKAANYGYLRRAIPESARPAVAFSFDLWHEFLDQTLSNGRTLRQEIHQRLEGFGWPPADPAAMAAALEGVRGLFTDTNATRFTAAQESAVLSALRDPAYGFDPDVKIRFRSSTNVEDAANFTGAGLYDSFSGCLRDELDADAIGPSVCDPSERNERGVFRAIRRVYASFYNDNAFQARRRLGVDEDTVGMGLLCHHSYLDETEMANGVAVLRRNGDWAEVSIVTQLGATSVTNPEDGSVPEEVYVYASPFGTHPEVRRTSNRVVLGQTVMDWDADYRALTSLLARAANRIAQETGAASPVLDFEFKKTRPGGALEVKQVRPLPQPDGAALVTPVLINRPAEFCVLQGEFGDIFANHRHKARLALSTRSVRLTAQNLRGPVLGPASATFNAGCRRETLTGVPDAWPGAARSYAEPALSYSWRVSGVPNPRTYTLTIPNVPASAPATRSPILWLTDLGVYDRPEFRIRAEYDRPVRVIGWDERITTALSDEATLCPCPDPTSGPLRVRTFEGPRGVRIETRYRWETPPTGIVAGYTASLAGFERTTITGLTARPVVLRSEFSQTYRPGHHNITEDFLFDPRLEPGIPPGQLAELRAQGVGFILVRDRFDGPEVTFYADDGCEPCAVDMNSTGEADVGDIFAFLRLWFAGEAAADFDGSGAPEVADIFGFLRAWFAGC